MAKKILFVDDDLVLQLLIKRKFEEYNKIFSVLLAGDGKDAVDKLKGNAISLVITDLQMPNMDGFSLLAYLSEKYPDIPVIIQTGHSTPKSKKAVLEGGAAGYIEKPYKVEDLGQQIITTLKKESEGGILRSISQEMFIQLIEMEQKTCTIRVIEKKSGKMGVLFFKSGDLQDARIRDRKGIAAAYEIFSWNEVTLSIQDDCAVNEKRINGDLQAILFDAMRMKDESRGDENSVAGKQDVTYTEKHFQKPEALAPEDIIRHKLENVAGGKKCHSGIYQDNSWNDLIVQASEIGKIFMAGTLKSCYIDKGESNDFILLPGKEVTVISVDPKCPRDRFLQVLSM